MTRIRKKIISYFYLLVITVALATLFHLKGHLNCRWQYINGLIWVVRATFVILNSSFTFSLYLFHLPFTFSPFFLFSLSIHFIVYKNILHDNGSAYHVRSLNILVHDALNIEMTVNVCHKNTFTLLARRHSSRIIKRRFATSENFL